MPRAETHRLENRSSARAQSVIRKRRRRSTSASKGSIGSSLSTTSPEPSVAHWMASCLRATSHLRECLAMVLKRRFFPIAHETFISTSPIERQPLLTHKAVTDEEFVRRRKDGTARRILANRALRDSGHPSAIEGSIVDLTALSAGGG
jgi:hypothetical protein